MLNQTEINKVISSMTEDLNKNIRILKQTFKNLEIRDNSNQTLLHILVDNKYDEEKCLLAIKSLLKIGMNPNATDEFNYIFIQTALYAGYSENFIINIINLASEYGLNINHVDSDKDTIMHTAIYSDDYLGEIINIYKTLLSKNFDSTKKDNLGKNLVEAIHYQNDESIRINNPQKIFSNEQIKEFTALYSQATNSKPPKAEINPKGQNTQQSINVTTPNITLNSLSPKDIEELEKYGTILNKKQYPTSPTIGREKELKNLFITLAQKTKQPILVGESGVGKTAIVEELVYRIQNNQVPNFLQNQLILEVDPNDIVSGCKYVGMFNKKAKKLLETCLKYNAILFIDEIHAIYGTGTGENDTIDMAELLKRYISRDNLRVIGTTTEDEYNEYFSNNALKRRFEKIIIKEPTEEVLKIILSKVINNYYLTTGITFQEERTKEAIINIIIELTRRSHRDYQDMLNNPDLSISIIDKAFAIANVYNSSFIEPSHFIEGLDYIDRIYEPPKEQAKRELNNINNITTKTNSHKKILTPNWNKK